MGLQVTDDDQTCQRKMKITLDNGSAKYRIIAYESGRIRINDETILDSIIVSPEKTELWDIENMDSLTQHHFEYLLTYEPEILILGTGSKQRFPASNLLTPLVQAGIGLEVMNTAAACRTYNILMSEGRNVVAALFMIE